MTKTPVDHHKSKRSVKGTGDLKIEEELLSKEDRNNDTLKSNENEIEEDSTSSVLTDEEGGSVSSGADTDQILANELDIVLKQATESKIVVPPVLPVDAKSEVGVLQPVVNGTEVNSKELGGDQESDLSSSTTSVPSRKSVKRKLEVEKRRSAKARKLSKEKRDKIKAQVARQVAELAAADQSTQPQVVQKTPFPLIPKLSAQRSRQQQAVDQARSRLGLSSKYGNLSKLVDLHRLLLKGNPFSLIEPKQVYPYFHLVPGINSAEMQPLIRAWQEKATRILYQLLLIETKGDITRIKKRTHLFGAEPELFRDALLLKIDIGLESEPIPKINAEVGPTKNNPAAQNVQGTSKQASGNSDLPPEKEPIKSNEYLSRIFLNVLQDYCTN